MFYHTAVPPSADEVQLACVTTSENANPSDNVPGMDYQDAVSALPKPTKGDCIKSEASVTYENIDIDRENEYMTIEDDRLSLTDYVNPSEGQYIRLSVNQPT